MSHKKFKTAITICTLFLASVSAFSKEPRKVVIHTSCSGTFTENHQPARIPAYIPSVYLEDTTLSFEASCIGCTITLLQNNNVVFTAIIDEDGIVLLPDYLFGVYELQLQFGSLTFVGEIEL